MKKTYEPIDDLTQRLCGYIAHGTTKTRWIQGRNGDGRKLHAIRVRGQLLSTEEDLLAFLTVDTESSDKPASQPKPRSAKARDKAVAAANAELEASGV